MDAATFKEIILSRYADMYRVAYAIVQDSDDAQDAVQDTVTRLWAGRRELDAIASPGAYCLTAVRRQSIDLLRARSRRPEAVDAIAEDELGGDGDGHARVEDADRLRLAEQLLAALPAAQRQVVRLRSHGDCTIDEIAAITGHSPANVRQLLSRARRRLKQIANNLL